MTTGIGVLIVDDDQAARRLLQEVMAREDYRVEAAETAQEAIEKAGATFFDVVLSDIRMPDRDGLEVLRALKRLAPETIVIMMTGISAVTRSALSAVRTAQPSMPGIITSSVITAGLISLASSSPR